MRHYVLGKHGWSAAGLCVLLPLCAPQPAHAQQTAPQGRLAIGSPLPGNLVAGRISVSVAYDSGLHRITSFTILVDDQIHSSRDFSGASNRGIQYLDLDTRTLEDGNHTVRIVARGPRGVIGIDQVNITVRNGVAGGMDTVPPLVQFRNLTEGSQVRGKVSIEVLAEDNTTTEMLVSIFVNQFPRLIKSRPPYTLELNTAEFLDPMTGTGKVTIEAWAYDRFNNLGKARAITLRVEPEGPSENQTKAPLGALTRPMQMDMMEPLLPAPLRAPMLEDLVMPVPGMRGEMPPGRVDPRLPLSARASSGGGRLANSRTAPAPGSRPTLPRMARATAPEVNPDFAPVGSASRGALAGGRTAVPFSRPRTAAEARAASVGDLGVAPAPTMSAGGAAAGGFRLATPPAPPARQPEPPAPVKVAKAPTLVTPREGLPAPRVEPKQPALAPARPKLPENTLRLPLGAPKPPAARPAAPVARASEPLTPYPGPRPSASRGTFKMASATTARKPLPEIEVVPVDMSAPLPMEGGAPRQSPDGLRPVTPSSVRPAPVAEKPSEGDPLIVLVDPRAPRQGGKVKADVFRLNVDKPRLPSDKSHRVRRGESLDIIAKRHGVTPKSLLVANGLTGPRALRTGSVIKVPGTFDVVMNDRRLAFDVSPRIENGVALTPFRQIFEHAGGVVVWQPDRQEVRAANDQTSVKLKIGSKEASVNQIIMVMDREAFLDSGRTIVPLSFMEKALDLKAEYDVKNGTVSLVRR